MKRAHFVPLLSLVLFGAVGCVGDFELCSDDVEVIEVPENRFGVATVNWFGRLDYLPHGALEEAVGYGEGGQGGAAASFEENGVGGVTLGEASIPSARLQVRTDEEIVERSYQDEGGREVVESWAITETIRTNDVFLFGCPEIEHSEFSLRIEEVTIDGQPSEDLSAYRSREASLEYPSEKDGFIFRSHFEEDEEDEDESDFLSYTERYRRAE